MGFNLFVFSVFILTFSSFNSAEVYCALYVKYGNLLAKCVVLGRKMLS